MGFSHLGVGQLLVPHYGGQTYTQKTKSVIGSSLIAYWPQAEASGTTALDESGNARNGSYTGVTLGQTGIGDGRTCPLFSSGRMAISGAQLTSLAGAFSGVAGTIAIWAKVSNVAVWTDGTVDYLLDFYVDASNRIRIYKNTVNNQIKFQYTAGGTTEGVDLAISTANWFNICLTWDRNAGANGQVIAYVNGSQTGLTQTALGTWSGGVLTKVVIGAFDAAALNPWSGWLAHVAVANRALTSTEVGLLANTF